jgi:hypothetical protein
LLLYAHLTWLARGYPAVHVATDIIINIIINIISISITFRSLGTEISPYSHWSAWVHHQLVTSRRIRLPVTSMLMHQVKHHHHQVKHTPGSGDSFPLVGDPDDAQEDDHSWRAKDTQPAVHASAGTCTIASEFASACVSRNGFQGAEKVSTYARSQTCFSEASSLATVHFTQSLKFPQSESWRLLFVDDDKRLAAHAKRADALERVRYRERDTMYSGP